MKVAALLIIGVAAQETPEFPKVWHSFEKLSGKQAGVIERYFDAAKKRTASFSGDDITIDDFSAGPATLNGKRYIIRVYGGQRHCQYWCESPARLQFVGDSLMSPDYEKSAKFTGTDTVDGVPVNVFEWASNLGPVPMSSYKIYAQQNQSVPVRHFLDYHPFGKKRYTQTIDFVNFETLNATDDSLFDLGPDAIHYCDSPQPSSKCGTSESILV